MTRQEFRNLSEITLFGISHIIEHGDCYLFARGAHQNDRVFHKAGLVPDLTYISAEAGENKIYQWVKDYLNLEGDAFITGTFPVVYSTLCSKWDAFYFICKALYDIEQGNPIEQNPLTPKWGDELKVHKNLTNIADRLSSSDIWSKLFFVSGSAKTDKINYISLANDDPKKIAYLDEARFNRVISSDDKNLYNSDVRYMGKVGKVLRKLFPDATDPEISEAVNVYYSVVTGDDLSFEIVEGKDITKFYDRANYSDILNVGTLNDSCMSYDCCSDYFGIYEDHAKMLCLFDLEGMVVGRAIIWETRCGKTLMDRVYGSDVTVEMFIAYAKKQGWWIKAHNNYYSGTQWFSPDDGYASEVRHSFIIDISCTYEFYPYMDTFKYLEEGESLCNCSSETDWDRELQDTDGNQDTRVEDINGNMIDEYDAHWSEWSEAYIHQDEAIYSPVMGDWLNSDDCVQINSGEWVHKDYDKIVEWDGEYYLIGDCVWSDHNTSYIPESDAYEHEGDYYTEDQYDEITEKEKQEA